MRGDAVLLSDSPHCGRPDPVTESGEFAAALGSHRQNTAVGNSSAELGILAVRHHHTLHAYIVESCVVNEMNLAPCSGCTNLASADSDALDFENARLNHRRRTVGGFEYADHLTGVAVRANSLV